MSDRHDLLSRSSGLASLGDTIGEACAICAEAVSTCISYYARGDAFLHILHTVYFTVIFVLRSIDKIPVNRHIYMVLQTLSSWIDAIVYRCLDAPGVSRRYDVNKLKIEMAFRSLVLVYVSEITSLLIH